MKVWRPSLFLFSSPRVDTLTDRMDRMEMDLPILPIEADRITTASSVINAIGPLRLLRSGNPRYFWQIRLHPTTRRIIRIDRGDIMRYKVDLYKERSRVFDNREGLIEFLKQSRPNTIEDVRKIYANGISDSIIDVYYVQKILNNG